METTSMFQDSLGLGNLVLADSTNLTDDGQGHDDEISKLSTATSRIQRDDGHKNSITEGTMKDNRGKKFGVLDKHRDGIFCDLDQAYTIDSSIYWTTDNSSEHTSVTELDETGQKCSSEVDLIDLTNRDFEDEGRLTPQPSLSQFCQFSIPGVPCSNCNTVEFSWLKKDLSQVLPSPSSSIVYGSSINGDPEQGSEYEDSSNLDLRFKTKHVNLNRRTKQAPKHRSELYHVVCSSIKITTPNPQGVILKRLRKTQYSFEKENFRNEGLKKLVIESCTTFCKTDSNYKFNTSALNLLYSSVDSYLQGFMGEFLQNLQ